MRYSFFILFLILITSTLSAEVTIPIVKSDSAYKNILRVSGYGQIDYYYTDQSSPNNAFELRRAIGIVKGDLPYGFSYKLTYAFAATARMLDLYLQWALWPEFSVRIGETKTPLTLENQIYPSTLETIFYPTVCQSLVALGSADVIGSNGGRDIGILSYGELIPINGRRLLEYSLGLFNGSGINTKDRDNHKEVSGSLYLMPLKGWKIGGSFYAGKATYTLAGDTVTGTYTRNRWSIGSSYKSEKITVRGEYICGKDNHTLRQGAYLFGAIRFFNQKWEMLGEIDYYNKVKGKPNNYLWEYTIGSNFYLNKLNKLQINYIRSNDSSEKHNRFVAQIQVGF